MKPLTILVYLELILPNVFYTFLEMVARGITTHNLPALPLQILQNLLVYILNPSIQIASRIYSIFRTIKGEP